MDLVYRGEAEAYACCRSRTVSFRGSPEAEKEAPIDLLPSSDEFSAYRYGVKVGCLVAEPSDMNAVIRELRAKKWLVKGRNVTSYSRASDLKEDSAEDPEMEKTGKKGKTHGKKAIHLSPKACASLDAILGTQSYSTLDAGLSPEDEAAVRKGLDSTLDLLGKGRVVFCPGVRLHSPECLGFVAVPTNSKEGMKGEQQEKKGRSPSEEVRNTNNTFTFIELFAGIGGFHLGLRELGGSCVFASEIDEQARQTYKANFGDSPAGDITQLEARNLPSFDLLTAGFPCQSFSKAGSQDAFEHRKGNLFYEVVRILRYHQPKAFLLENVAFLLRMFEGDTAKEVLSELTSCGYNVHVRVINAEILVPQRRRRVYFVGIRSDLEGSSSTGRLSPFPPSPAVPSTVTQPDSPSSGSSAVALKKTKVMRTEAFEWPVIPDLSPHVKDILEDEKVVPADLTLSEQQWKNITDSSYHVTVEKGPQWRFVNLNGAARTLMSMYKHSYHMYSEFVPSKEALALLAAATDEAPCDPSSLPPPRFFSPRECARLQGFPESFVVDACRDNNRFYHQIGNAVSPPVIGAIGFQIVKSVFPEAFAAGSLSGSSASEFAMSLVSRARPSQSPI